ncbi:hypothetical protein [Gracilibacillus sp. YIM 98692]|uniref:hypothetical protein n=1 Tax=Gracilibacillus sp. YIM 98692 TaxID=2663532 RepID=UPI0013D0D263|nr:hypothetical protein [Gracilibacillus sp. YIM 98692]
MKKILKPTEENIKLLAKHISNHSEIDGQYFEIGSLLLVNVSLHNDQDHFWEYEIYKLDEEGNGYKFESYTVNMSDDDGERLAAFLLEHERTHYCYFCDPITQKLVWESYHDKLVPAHRIKEYKKAFDQYSKEV